MAKPVLLEVHLLDVVVGVLQRHHQAGHDERLLVSLREGDVVEVDDFQAGVVEVHASDHPQEPVAARVLVRQRLFTRTDSGVGVHGEAPVLEFILRDIL